MSTALLLKLGRHDRLCPEDAELLQRAFSRERTFQADQDIVGSGECNTTVAVVLEGFAARYKVLADGKRQITAVLIPGDFADLHGFLLKRMDHGVTALTDCRVGTLDHDQLLRMTDAAPRLARLLWLDTAIDGAIHREWLVAMGRRRKAAQLAHLICELYARLSVVGRTDALSFHLPLSQVELSDVLGVSVVHCNRVLQTLRRERLVTWSSQMVRIEDPERLRALAEFDPAYLGFGADAWTAMTTTPGSERRMSDAAQ